MALRKRSLTLSGHRTSVALEEPFWEVLAEMAAARGQSLGALVVAIDAARGPGLGLASALRLAVLADLRGRPGAPAALGRNPPEGAAARGRPRGRD